MTTPTVSVIIPTYNRASLLPRAIHSVLGQTFGDLELLVVDDASTDATEEVVRGIADPRLRYLRRPANGGVSAAQNSGLAAARGEFVSFLHSDDEYLPVKLEAQVPLLRATDAGAVKGAVMIVEPDGEVLRRSNLRGTTYENWLGFEKGVHVSPMLIRRPLAQALRFDESLPGWEDVDFLIRFFRISRLEISDEPVVRLHTDGGHRLSSAANQLRGMRGLFAKYERELRARPEARYRWHLLAAHFCARLGDAAGARGHLHECLAARPVAPALWLLYLMSLAGDRGFMRAYRAYVGASRAKASARRLRPRGTIPSREQA
jgi:glycosyltransferase involved in cell wall biosynthesis